MISIDVPTYVCTWKRIFDFRLQYIHCGCGGSICVSRAYKHTVVIKKFHVSCSMLGRSLDITSVSSIRQHSIARTSTTYSSTWKGPPPSHPSPRRRFKRTLQVICLLCSIIFWINTATSTQHQQPSTTPLPSFSIYPNGEQTNDCLILLHPLGFHFTSS